MHHYPAKLAITPAKIRRVKYLQRIIRLQQKRSRNTASFASSLVEAAGFEPASEGVPTAVSTGVAPGLISIFNPPGAEGLKRQAD
jgi:hypothetical protein